MPSLDTCIILTKDVKFFCPPGYDDGIFQVVATLLKNKVEQAKQSGAENAKTVNAIDCKSFINFFSIPEQMFDAATSQVTREDTPEILGTSTD